MAKGRGQPSKYDTHVKPRLAEIEKMAETMTDKQIAKAIGVHISTWCDYKNKYPELVEALKKGRERLVRDLIGTLVRKAKGFQYSEKKIIREKGVVVREEEYIKSSLPDVAALNLLLKNYNKENWSNDPQVIELRKKELKLREKQIEAGEW